MAIKLRAGRDHLRALIAREDDVSFTTGAQPESPEPVRSVLDELPIAAFPLFEIMRRGWLDATRAAARENPRAHISAYLAQSSAPQMAPALLRHTQGQEDMRRRAGTLLWLTRVDARSQKEFPQLKNYSPDLDRDFLKEVSKLSGRSQGPALVRDALAEVGIAFITEAHLPNTRLDGAAMWSSNRVPLIALTLRHNRIDNFWFTLLHELAHVVLHLQDASHQFFVDNLDSIAENDMEREANVLAGQALLPRQIWNRSDVRRRPSRPGIRQLAERLGIHPAVVAGRIQKEQNRYDLFRDIVDEQSVQDYFPTFQVR